MAMSTKIKFYSSRNINAPQIARTYGCLIDILDACLVNGFGGQAVSVMSASDKTVTVDFGKAHNFLQYQVIKISGASPNEYNGEHRILSVTPNTITFSIDNTPSSTIATGTITCSLPSLGFEKSFSSSSTLGKRAAYRSTNTLLASRPFLRVLDERTSAYNAQYAMYAKVGIVENMTGIDVMSGVQAPYIASAATRNWTSTGSGSTIKYGWARWYYATCTDMYADSYSFNNFDVNSFITPEWFLIGDGDTFYFMPCVNFVDTDPVLKTYSFCYGFGEFNKIQDNDTSNTFLLSTLLYDIADNTPLRSNYSSAPLKSISMLSKDQVNICLQRATNNASNYAQAAFSSNVAAQDYSGSKDYQYFNSPSSGNNYGVVFSVPIIVEVDSSLSNLSYRGVPKFLKHIPHKTPFNELDTLTIGNGIYIVKNTININAGYGQVAFCLNEDEI